MKLLLIALLALLAGCSSPNNLNPRVDEPLRPVSEVDLQRYMGEWYVIANIPYYFERGNVGARAIYRMRDDGRMDDIYRYYPGDFEAEEREMSGVAWVVDDTSNAVWQVRFIWPFKVDYYILYLDEDYQHVAVGHPDKDLAWVMAREPRMETADYDRVLLALWQQGFDTQHLRKIPQFPEDIGKPGFQ